MNTRLSLVALMSFLTLPFAVCGGGDGSDSASAPRRFVSVGTAPPGGAFFVVGGALGDVLGEHGPGWNVTAEATKGSQENIRRLARGELDVALSNSAITYFAARGDEGWERAFPVRAVMTLAPNVAMFVTPSRSGVSSISDLRGKRVVVGPAGAGFEWFVGPIVRAHGLTYDDFTPLNNTQSGAVDMLADGSAVAAILGGAVPTASIVQASTSQEIRLVPFAPDVRQRLIDEYPFFRPHTIPPDTYRGQTEPYEGLDVGSMHLITSADADEELIYTIAKTIYENRASVTEKHPAGSSIRPENVVRDTGVEFHEGAIRFYREIGIWPEQEGDHAP